MDNQSKDPSSLLNNRKWDGYSGSQLLGKTKIKSLGFWSNQGEEVEVKLKIIKFLIIRSKYWEENESNHHRKWKIEILCQRMLWY